MKIFRPTPKLTEIPGLLRATPAMIRDLFARRYRQLPYATLLGGLLGSVYLINPLDFIPDMLPVVGVVDDTLIVGLFLALLSKDVKKYQLWKSKNETLPSPRT